MSLSVSSSESPTSDELLHYFRRNLNVGLNADFVLSIPPEFYELLAMFGDPHKNLPPVIHVAGTNGKGSVCAYLRAMLEAAGKKVHVYTSPHLVTFHERIRIAGDLITEDELVELVEECIGYAEVINARKPQSISYFEAATAVAMAAFARYRDINGKPADYTLMEVGLGGRLDSTNVVDPKLATVITRISGDHRKELGNTIREIALEKAGIMRAGVPCFTAYQPDGSAEQALWMAAQKVGAPLHNGCWNWQAKKTASGFSFKDEFGELDLPLPALLGSHQIENAALAIAVLRRMVPGMTRGQIAEGLQSVEWPGRLQLLQREKNSLAALVPVGSELWLDGGHNDSAGEVLALQAEEWTKDKKPLFVICGMLTTKRPEEFLLPLKPYIAALQTISIRNEHDSHTAQHLADIVRETVGIENVGASSSLEEAIRNLRKLNKEPKRILICGSLYLAGQVLAY